MRRVIFNVGVGLAAGLMLVGAQPAQAISVEVQGLPAAVTAGDNFSVEIVVTGIVDEIIAAWDVDVGFDPALLDAKVVSFLFAPWGDGGDVINDASFEPDFVDVFLVSLLSDAELAAIQCPGGVCSATVLLTTVSFEALADGAPVVSLINWGLANDVKCAENVQCYPPKHVPEPGSLALLGLGLLGLATRRRRAA